MNDADDNKKKYELLKTARHLLQQEYANARAAQYQQWLAGSKTSWSSNGTLLPYPTGPLYPTEAEIVAKALELYNLSINNTPPPQPKDIITSIFTAPASDALIVETANVTQALVDAALTNVESSPPSDEIIEEVIKPIVEEVIEEVIEEIVEEVNDPVQDDAYTQESTTQPAIEKHSLLRNVLSSWLQKNKDKE